WQPEPFERWRGLPLLSQLDTTIHNERPLRGPFVASGAWHDRRVLSTQRARDDRVLTVPNAISIVRLLCVPLFVYLLFGRDDRAYAAWLLGALGATDWVDGYIARHFDQVSTLGKVLDPMADRILLGVAVIALLVDGTVPTW